jgi:hypothetical protein
MFSLDVSGWSIVLRTVIVYAGVQLAWSWSASAFAARRRPSTSSPSC